MTAAAPERKSSRLVNVALLAVAFCIGAVIVYLFMTFLRPGCEGTVNRTGNNTNKPIHPGHSHRLIKNMLLPKHVRPEQYDLRLKAFLPGYGATIPKDKELIFEAVILIHLVAEKPTDTVKLNSVGLTYDKESCYVENEKKVAVVDVQVDEDSQKVTFKFAQPVSGKFRLFVTYQGPVRKELSGLYQTTYINAHGVKKIAATTQMEPMDARKMVPCFDEPEWKAKWAVTVVHPRGTRAVSNGIELGESIPVDEDFLETQFKATPAMSSYLLAILISDFEFLEGKTKNGVRVRIWCRPETKHTAKYALEAGIKALEQLEEFYGVKFPLEKQDMVALPDFAMGAMENWGLITYRETALLYDPDNYYLDNKQRVATVIAHELAHMWFGNLVTMKWWDDIWLNEGFASLVENIGVDMISDGKFEMEDQFVTYQHQWTLKVDASRSSHPIVNQVEYYEEVEDLFDAISYRKGAAFLSCVKRILGDSFQKGVTNYLKKYSYQNADHRNLFAEWDAVVPETMIGPDGQKLNVTDFALKWTLQMGYPYLTLVDLNRTHYEVTQTRYLINPDAKEREKFMNPPYKYKWDVPVWYQVGEDSSVQLAWLPYQGRLFLPKTPEALVLNADSYAIARMNYNEDGWRKILDQLKRNSSIYSARTKYRIVKDIFGMAEIEVISYRLAFDVADYIVKEDTGLPWMAIFSEIKSIREYYGTNPAVRALDEYVKKLLTPIYENLDIDLLINEITDEVSYMKNDHRVKQWLRYCDVDETTCAQKKKQFFEEGFRQPCAENDEPSSICSRVPPAIREAIYCHAVKYGDDTDFELILSMFKKETLQLESNRLMRALSCSRDVATLKWLLAETLNRDKGIIRGQDVGPMYAYLSLNEVASELLLDNLLSNWDEIYKKYSSEQSILNKIIQYSTDNIRSKYRLDILKTFVTEDGHAKKYYEFTKSEQKAQKRIEWLNKNGAKIVKFFRAKTENNVL